MLFLLAEAPSCLPKTLSTDLSTFITEVASYNNFAMLKNLLLDEMEDKDLELNMKILYPETERMWLDQRSGSRGRGV